MHAPFHKQAFILPLLSFFILGEYRILRMASFKLIWLLGGLPGATSSLQVPGTAARAIPSTWGNDACDKLCWEVRHVTRLSRPSCFSR